MCALDGEGISAGMPRSGFEEARVEDALNLLVPERADALRVREVPQRERDSQVRRREIRQQELALARPQQTVKRRQVLEV
jgi:hypothetical protein